MAHITRSYLTDAQIERFLRDVSVDESGCWPWLGFRNDEGYGHTVFSDTTIKMAHRVSYLIHYGALDLDLTIDHLCFVTSCVNPEHLDLVTRAENTRRQFQRIKEERRPLVERAALAYASGLSIDDITAQMGVPYSTIRRWLREAGAEMRPRGRYARKNLVK